MKLEENGLEAGFAGGSISGGQAPLTLAGMEAALIELRDLEWRAPAGGRSLGTSPWAKDGPWSLAQREVGDIAGEYSETLLVNEAGKELLVRKLDTPRPRTPLRSVEVARHQQLWGWLSLLLVRDEDTGDVVDATDLRIVWAASFYLWRGEITDWSAIQRRIAYPRSTRRLAGRCVEAVAKLWCLVNGVPARHFRPAIAEQAYSFNRAARQNS